MRKWTPTDVLLEIAQMYAAGEPLNYLAVERNHLGLMRAATHLWGSWRQAVEAVGIDYDKIRKYRIWTRERVIERIRWWYERGADLSWGHVSTLLDPPLAAAAIRRKRFSSWPTALRAAGLDDERIARYRHWDREKVMARLTRRIAEGMSLRVSDVMMEDPALVAAARRRFARWHEAVLAAASWGNLSVALPGRQKKIASLTGAAVGKWPEADWDHPSEAPRKVAHKRLPAAARTTEKV